MLDLKHESQTGRVTGTIAMLGAEVPIQGRVRELTLVIESMGGIPVSATGSSMTGKLAGAALVLTVADAGEAPKTMTMTRVGGRAESDKQSIKPGAVPEHRTPAATPPPPRADAAGPQDFSGRWEVVSDDRTSAEILELEVSGAAVSGTLAEIERGYFSGRESLKGQYKIRGSMRSGRLDVTFSDSSGQGGAPLTGTIFRRGEYIIIRVGQNEHGLARPGRDIVESAEGSAEAAALASAIVGRVYSTSSQAAGRGAFVGGRVRLALCADGGIEFDASDVASTPGSLPGQGVDLGNTVTRRGTWSVVMLAGAPLVRAQWRGTGTSYSLTGYFKIRPSPDGGSANVDGRELPVTGKC